MQRPAIDDIEKVLVAKKASGIDPLLRIVWLGAVRPLLDLTLSGTAEVEHQHPRPNRIPSLQSRVARESRSPITRPKKIPASLLRALICGCIRFRSASYSRP